MKTKMKRGALALAVLMIFSLLAGCSCSKAENNATQTAAGAEPTVQQNEEVRKEEDASDSMTVYNAGDLLQITIDQIAEINNCAVEDLNITYDDAGRITFIGNRFSTEKILSEDDACKMLAALMDLASIKVDLHYYGVSESKITGDRYYSFYQSEEIEPDPGVKMLVDSKAGCIKLITDKDGNTIGLSSCVGDKEQIQEYPKEQWVSREEALNFVRKNLAPGENIIEELTDVAYLDDEGAIMRCSISGKRLPVWAIVTDYCLLPGWNGTMYCISMIGNPIQYTNGTTAKECHVAQYIPLRTPDRQGVDEISGEITSLAFFDNMEDAGQYSFHVDEANWVQDAREGYQFKQKDMIISLMYDTANNRYVMGDFNEKILVSDYYTYYAQGNAVPNMLVSETPEDINSWHWSKPETQMPDGTSCSLFLNMDYAVSMYSVICKVHENYKTQLGVNSYDGNGIPLMLLLYETQDGKPYPTNLSEFEYNATNLGIYNDWGVMATSPSCSWGADETVLAHEYAHGIDRSNAALKSGNLTGSVEEAFADIMSLGVNNAAYQTNNTRLVYEDTPTGTMRDAADPRAYRQPRYIGDEFYLNEVDFTISGMFGETDAGGVHTNLGPTVYLAYSVSNANSSINGKPMEWKEIAELFYEASFLRTTDYGYDELGAYLNFAAKEIGLDDEKLNTLKFYTQEYGFCSDQSRLEKVLDATGIPVIRLSADMDDTVEGRAFMITDSHSSALAVLGKEPQTIRISDELQKESRVNLYSPYVNGADNLTKLMQATYVEKPMKGDAVIHISTIQVNPGDTYDFNENTVTLIENLEKERIVYKDDDGRCATFLKPCEILVSGQFGENGGNLFHVICGTPDEIREEQQRENEPHTFGAAAKDGQNHEVQMVIINDLDKDISAIFLAQPSAETWGNNILGEGTLPKGETINGRFGFNAENMVWDIRVILEDGQDWSFSQNDFSELSLEQGLILRFIWNDQGGMTLRHQ